VVDGDGFENRGGADFEQRQQKWEPVLRPALRQQKDSS
jgi:hypothetical protein